MKNFQVELWAVPSDYCFRSLGRLVWAVVKTNSMNYLSVVTGSTRASKES